MTFSTKAAINSVKHLCDVFNADAAHLSWGGYTLYSIYGFTANDNAFNVAHSIKFGNEDKKGWSSLFNFVKAVHGVNIDAKHKIILTDQQKGLLGALTLFEALQQFCCSFHRYV